MQTSVRKPVAAVAIVLALVAGWVPGAAATDLPQPSGPVLLTVNGAIARTNGPGIAQFDLPMLEALGITSFTTSTIWTEGESLFQGVLLGVLLDHLGADGTEVVATAINEYRVTIPLEDVGPEAPIIAYRRDGAPMPLRNKGPLWIVYPYDSNPDYRTEIVHSRSIWQMEHLSVR